MHTITIANIIRELIVEGNEEKFRVTAHIKNDAKEVVEVKNFHYPLTHTAEMITADLKKVLETFISEEANKEKAIEQGKVDTGAQETIIELKGKTL